MKSKKYQLSAIILALALMIGACSFPTITISMPPTAPSVSPGVTSIPATAAQVASPAPVNELPTAQLPTPATTYSSYPGDPGTILAAVKDESFPSSYGDNFGTNEYERPFQLDNTYRPDADIVAAYIADNEWYYFTTEVAGVNPASKTLDTPFGFEIDYDGDGRGDFLLWAIPPFAPKWTNSNVQVYADTNRDVGNQDPILSDAPVTLKSNGYETVLVSNGSGSDPEAAWARLSPVSPNTLQIAVKKSLINQLAFLWWAWTDFGVGNPVQFDYNDFYTAQQAGSPYAANPYFPLKALFGMDNTCRVAYGFTPSGNEPGLCGAIQPTQIPAVIPTVGVTKFPIPLSTPTNTPKPPKKPTSTLTQVPPPACLDIQITAQVTDGSRWDPTWASGITLCIGGDCKNPDSNGYAVWYLPAGAYTIKAASPAYGIHPDQASTKKGCGEKDLIQFVIGPG